MGGTVLAHRPLPTHHDDRPIDAAAASPQIRAMTTPRLPADLSPPRMDALARLPLFFALEARRAVVAGGNAQAAWKAELLSAAGANVAVYTPAPAEEMAALAEAPPRGAVTIHRRDAAAEDLAGAAIAVGAFDDDDDAARFAAAARAQGVPVNVVDRPAFCDFAFGAIVNRSPLVIGISTDGAAPAFGMAVRAKIEAMIPKGFARWVEAARQWRTALASSGLSFPGRQQFWRIFSNYAATHPNHEPTRSDFDGFLAETTSETPDPDNGAVTLVGAGPGDPELLTLRAVRALQAADIILVDDLVAPDILDFARREAKKMLVGKTGHGPSCKQEEINTLMVTLARAGKRVVRLKGGDPMIFGRATEEIAACRAAGIPVEVVPGVSAAQGAASRLGVSLTHRETARRVQFVTGHGADGRLPADIDWPSIADPGATTVVYMPVKTHAAFAQAAIAAGLDGATPAVAVINATRPDEQVIVATIATLPDRLAAAAVSGPAVVMIGQVFGRAAGAMAAPAGAKAAG
jgi:uroporphyrin-III C-methyltransferase / precorrin-2 dehydrogenase / sirohydrochlorin ferrochelatase